MSEPLALEGLRVLDFSRLLPGPYASLVLADLGADVVKVEAREGGDYLRFMPPLTGKVSYAFAALNAGKRSIALDLKHPDGAKLAFDLAMKADVLIESFRPGVMARLGLGYEALSAANPGLVYCAISGFGQDGPLADAAGHDLNYASLGGAIGLAGPAAGAPAVPPIQMADFGGALWGLVGILAAVERRHKTGRGGFVDISMTDAVLAYLSAALAPHLGGGAAPPARGEDTLTGGQPCYAVYETADGGFMALAALEPKFWGAFCLAAGRPDLMRRQYGDAGLRAELEALFRSRPRAAWEAAFAGTDACCTPVLGPDELAASALHEARRNVITDAAGLRRVRTPVRPVDAPPPGRAPGLGADTRAVLAELGLDDAAIDALVAAKVVTDGGAGGAV